MDPKIKPIITIKELEKVDIRVGTIEKVEDIEASDKLVKLSVNFGEFERTIVAGLKKEREDPTETEGSQALFVVNLSQELYDAMPVYPGDPEVEINQVHRLDEEGWRLRSLFLTTHTGTHVNVPAHMVKNGDVLDKVDLKRFYVESILYEPGVELSETVGVLFYGQVIDDRICSQLVEAKPNFVGLSEKHNFDIEIEKKLLEANIVSYENLVNLEKLPNKFQFFGFPLRIKNADGSPVRAIAVINE